MPENGKSIRMKNSDTRIDNYIAKSAPFAKTILNHLRKQVHRACPQVTETIKWGFPHFEFHGMLCFMASFKTHCTFGFWRADLLPALKEKANTTGKKGMGQFGRLSTVKDLPSNSVLYAWIREAANLNKQGVPIVLKKKISKKTVLKVPDYFIKTLNSNKKLHEKFNQLSPAQRNEYVEWITEAKTEATRYSRIKSMKEWVKEGKPRNWKYLYKYKTP